MFATRDVSFAFVLQFNEFKNKYPAIGRKAASRYSHMSWTISRRKNDDIDDVQEWFEQHQPLMSSAVATGLWLGLLHATAIIALIAAVH